MSLLNFKNHGVSRVVTAPSPAASGTSFTITEDDGDLFNDTTADGPFIIEVGPLGRSPLKTNSELILVNTRVEDAFTVCARQQEGTAARTIKAGDRVANVLTAGQWKQLVDRLTAAEARPQVIFGYGDPNGVQMGNIGWTYWQLDVVIDGVVRPMPWCKTMDNSNTGWK